MARWWFLSLAGCYGATPPAGVPCDPAMPSCPAGQMCVARGGEFVCDSEPGDPPTDGPTMDTSSADDIDGDGVPNASDNCATIANADQANEDGDATGDVCDKCPPVPDTGADADGDGVGDACDPHVMIPGDSIALFEGFSGTTLPAGWTATGTWAVTAGSLVSVADDNQLSTLVVPYANTPNQTMSTHATIVALTQDTGGSIGIVDRFNGNAGLHCGGGRSLSNELFGLVDASNGSFLGQRPHPFDPGTVYRITFTRVDKRYDCSTVQAGGDTVSVSRDFDQAMGPNVGFRNRVATASFAYLMIVKSP